MERLSCLGHEILVIDHNFLWKQEKSNHVYIKRFIFNNNPKVKPNSTNIIISRPSIISIPLLDLISIPFFHTKEILFEIVRFKPDMIIGFGILNNFIALLLSKIFRIPFIYYLIDHLHALLPIEILQQLAKGIEEINIRHANEVFVINKGLRDYVGEMGGNKEKVHIFPGGVDLAKYQDKSKREDYRNKLLINQNDIVLFFMGWLYDFSGLKEVSDYFLENEHNLENIKLLVVGKGDLFNYLTNCKNKLKNKDKIILTGQVDFKNIPFYLQASDICLLPAYKIQIMNNIVPIKLYEYLGAGKPVISTKLHGVFKEFGENNGIVYINNPLEVFNKISIILKNYQNISNQATNFASNYDWNVIIKNFENYLLKSVING